MCRGECFQTTSFSEPGKLLFPNSVPSHIITREGGEKNLYHFSDALYHRYILERALDVSVTGSPQL
jgi:hypothetical protein